MYDNPQFVDSETDVAWTVYQGPERRSSAAPQSHCLKRMLDEIDYGMLLVSADQQVLYLNHAAWLELDGEHPLQIIGRALLAQRDQDVAPLHEALVAARRGLRKLLTLGCAEQRVTVSVVPLTAGAQPQAVGQGQSILLVLGKRQVCQSLALQGLARELGLNWGSQSALKALYFKVQSQVFMMSFLQLVFIMMILVSLAFIPLFLLRFNRPPTVVVDSH